MKKLLILTFVFGVVMGCGRSEPPELTIDVAPKGNLSVNQKIVTKGQLAQNQPLCAEAGNAKIAAFIQTFEGRSLYSGSSFWPAIKLPKEASPSQVCEALLKSRFVQFTSYSIITNETAQMVLDHVTVDTNGKPKWIPVKEPVTVTFIQTDVGEMIIFMDHKEGGWRTSVYKINRKGDEPWTSIKTK